MIKRLFFIILSFSTISTLSAQDIGLHFDGVDDYVETNVSGPSGSASRTIEAWIYTTKNSLPSAGGQSVIVDWGTFVTGSRFTFNVLWNNAIRLEVGGNGISGTIAVNDGAWHHVAVVYDSNVAINQFKLYVDGQLDVQGNLTVPVNTGAANNIVIGRRIDNINYFEGGIDDIRIYNTVRDSATIYSDYMEQLCVYPSDLTHYFKLNEGTPGADNSSMDATLESMSNTTGDLMNFALTGMTSNWIVGAGLSGGNTSVSVTEEACQSYQSPSGATYTSSTIFNDTIPNSAGCDSIITIDLTILQTDSTSEQLSGCDSIEFDGTWYTADNQIVLTTTLSNGCDSTHTVDIVITGQSLETSETLSSCDSVMINNTWYSQDQEVVINGITSSGCDSIHTIIVVITGQSVETSESISSCDSFVLDGTTYTQSQEIIISGITSSGCDSMHTIDLTIEEIDFEVVNVGTSVSVTSDATAFAWFNCIDDTAIPAETSSDFFPAWPGSYQVYVEMTSGNCITTSECQNIVISNLSEVYNTDFELYPNPSNGEFLIQLESDIKASHVEIVNLIGAVVYSERLKDVSTFNVKTNLEAGTYFTIIKTSEGLYAKKFAVK